MISYAQNYEDIMLWRALKHIKNGFYIDVGAAWPDNDSVTKLFYDNGWNGINIEPNKDLYIILCDQRKNDINLNIALSDKEGSGDFYLLENAGLSTLEKEIIKIHKTDYSIIKVEKAFINTLNNIFNKYCNNKEVHFLKIDVEGYEKKVITGNNWKKNRPWIVIIESTIPMCQTENYQEWESILEENDYIFVYADGLNRFYIAKEHSDLIQSFAYPPNVFDGFINIREVKLNGQARQAETRAQEAEVRAAQAEVQARQAEARAQEAAARAAEAEAQARQAEARAQEAEVRAAQAEGTLYAVYNSHSWKITKPLRIISIFINKLSIAIINFLRRR